MEGDLTGWDATLETLNFNPLPPHGGRPCHRSIQLTGKNFNPLPPHGGRLEKNGFIYGVSYISIHSLRMEGDIGRCTAGITFGYFNPLPPHGGRPLFRSRFRFPRKFQSTPSAWRETGLLLGDGGGNSHFNPLPPHGGRPDSVHDGRKPKTISIHSLRMEGDHSSSRSSCGASISIHSLRMEGDI